jgi:hypothetical protein
VSKNLLQHSSLLLFFRHCFAATWAVALAVGGGWWFLVRPWARSLWTTAVAFALGYFVYLIGCAMLAYSPKERTQVRNLGRRLVTGRDPIRGLVQVQD